MHLKKVCAAESERLRTRPDGAPKVITIDHFVTNEQDQTPTASFLKE